MSCAYRNDIELVDEFGRRPFVRKQGYSEIYLPECFDLRAFTEELEHLGVNEFWILDDDTERAADALQDWNAYLRTGKMRGTEKRNQTLAYSGHLYRGIE